MFDLALRILFAFCGKNRRFCSVPVCSLDKSGGLLMLFLLDIEI
jgi:hypothetical protein